MAQKKQATGDAKQVPAGALDPDDLVLVGVDDHPEGSELADKRAEGTPSAELIASVLEFGVLTPVLVRRRADKLLEVVDGRQRVLAARVANKMLRKRRKEALRVQYAALPAEQADRLFAHGAKLTTNANRLDDDVMEKVSKLETYLAEEGASPELASIVFGVTMTTVRTWTALGGAVGKIKKAVRDGMISATAGGKLAKLPKEEQPSALEALLESEGRPTARRAERLAQRTREDREADQQGLDPKPEPPAKKLLKRIAEGDQEKLGLLPAVRQALLWVLGEAPAENVPTLAAALSRLEEEPKKPRGKRKTLEELAVQIEDVP